MWGLTLTLRVSDVMTPQVVVISPKDTLARARNLMLHHDISRLVVVDETLKPIGILTETNIAMKVWEESGGRIARTIDEILVEEVMSSPVITIGPRTYLKNAARIMVKRKISGLPVTDSSGRLLGIVTKTDLTRAYALYYSGYFKVSDIMSTPVVTVNPAHTIYRVGRLMKEHGISRVVVVDGKVPIGVITKTDLTFITLTTHPRRLKFVKAIASEGKVSRVVKIFRIPIVADMMTSNPITILEDEDSAKAAEIMIRNGISGLPVVNSDGELTGIITKTDIVKAMAKMDSR
mgnify:CR=1 FL=1